MNIVLGSCDKQTNELVSILTYYIFKCKVIYRLKLGNKCPWTMFIAELKSLVTCEFLTNKEKAKKKWSKLDFQKLETAFNVVIDM